MNSLLKRSAIRLLLTASLSITLYSPVIAQSTSPTLLQQAEEALQSGNCALAETKWQEIVRTLPTGSRDFSPSYFNLGRALACQQKLDEAVNTYRKSIQAGDSSKLAIPASVYFYLGDALYALAHQNASDQQKFRSLLQESISIYSQSIQKEASDNRNDYQAFVSLGNALDDLGNSINDTAIINQALGAYRKAIQINRNGFLAYYNLGIALKRQNQLEDAISAYHAARRSSPADQRPLDALISSYREVLRRDSRNMSAYLQLGDLLTARGNYTDALGSFEQALVSAPGNPEVAASVYNSRGRVFFRQNRYEDAIQEFRRVFDYQSDYAFAHTNIASALAAQNKFDAAIEAYQAALSNSNQEGSPSSAHVLAHNGLGSIYLRQNNIDQAANEFKAALQIDPNSEIARSNLAEVQSRREISQCSASLPSASAEPLVDVLRSVVLIRARVTEGTGSGTGWVVKREGTKAWIVTNRHVIQDQQTGNNSQQIKVSLYGKGQSGQSQPCGTLNARVFQVSTNPKLDIAVVQVDGLPEDIQALKLAATPPALETEIRIIGHPGDSEGKQFFYWSSLSGTINGISNEEMQLTATLGGGVSGAPVLNKRNNQVLGLVWGGNQLDRGGILGEALPTDFFRQQLREWGML